MLDQSTITLDLEPIDVVRIMDALSTRQDLLKMFNPTHKDIQEAERLISQLNQKFNEYHGV